MKYFKLLLIFSLFISSMRAQTFEYMDVFELEYVSDPQISPDGSQIVYVRNYMDVMMDRVRGDLWIINADGSKNRPFISNARSPRWSADGSELFYLSSEEGSTQIYKRWMADGQSVKLTRLTKSPGSISLSPDGKWISFSMFVETAPKGFAKMPAKPKGAKWAPPVKYIDKMLYRSNGAGYLPDGYTHLFMISTNGGTARQLTNGDFNHGGSTSWTPDSKYLLFSANRHPDGAYDPLNSEVYELTVGDGSIKALTSRKGPDGSPSVSPDGKQVAYLGFDDRLQGYQVTRLYVMNRDGSKAKMISADLDRDVAGVKWASDSKGVFFQYDDKGNTKIAHMDMKGKVSVLADDLGGNSIGRPYGGGSFSVAQNGTFAFTHSTPDHPADLAVGTKGQEVKRLTNWNEDLFGFKNLGAVEEIWWKSSFDQRDVQGWIVKPHDFDPNKKDIHLLSKQN